MRKLLFLLAFSLFTALFFSLSVPSVHADCAPIRDSNGNIIGGGKGAASCYCPNGISGTSCYYPDVGGSAGGPYSACEIGCPKVTWTTCTCSAGPSAPFCGDNSCNNGETCSTCPGDCGTCSGGGGSGPPSGGGGGGCSAPDVCVPSGANCGTQGRPGPVNGGSCSAGNMCCGPLGGGGGGPVNPWHWSSYLMFPMLSSQTVAVNKEFNNWVDPNDDSTAYVELNIIGGNAHFIGPPVGFNSPGILFSPTHYRSTGHETTWGLQTVSDKQWGVHMIADGPGRIEVKANVWSTGAGYLANLYTSIHHVDAYAVCAPDILFTANGIPNSTTVNSGSTVTLAWKVAKGSNCVGGGDMSGAVNPIDTRVIPNVTSNKFYTITCDALGGRKMTGSLAVNVSGLSPLPTVNLTINSRPDNVVYIENWSAPGTDTRLKWTTTDATSCVGSSNPPACGSPYSYYYFPCPYTGVNMGYFFWDKAQALNGNIQVPANDGSSYTLTCTGPGGTASKTIMVDEGAPPTTGCGVVVSQCALPAPQPPASSVCAVNAVTPKLTTWTWQAVANVDSYYFSVEDSSGIVIIANALRTGASLGCPYTTTGTGTCTVSNISLMPGKTYRAIVSAHSVSGICSPDSIPAVSANFTLNTCGSPITSTIETDPTNTAKIVAGACTVAGATAYTNGGTIGASTVPAGSSYTGTVDAAGNYTIATVPNRTAPTGYNLTFTPPAGYFVTCPVGGTYPNISVPTVPDLPFFVSPIAERWFQTVGADIAALSPASRPVNDPIPVAACSGTGCDPVLSVQQVAGNAQTSGMLLVNSSAPQCKLSSAGGAPNNVSSPTSRLATVPSNPVLKEGYDYFYRLYSMGVPPITDDFAVPTNAQKPTFAPLGGKNAYYHNGNLTVDTPWAVNAGEKIVVFVNGNLTINKNITMSNSNAFVGFIASGNIVITANVGTATKPFANQKTGQVQGMYFADGTLTVDTAGAAGTDMKFVGEGTFAGRSGISLLRDFKNGGNGSENNAGPATLFIYRPDLLRNAPDQMKAPSYVWKEVNP